MGAHPEHGSLEASTVLLWHFIAGSERTFWSGAQEIKFLI